MKNWYSKGNKVRQRRKICDGGGISEISSDFHQRGLCGVLSEGDGRQLSRTKCEKWDINAKSHYSLEKQIILRR